MKKNQQKCSFVAYRSSHIVLGSSSFGLKTKLVCNHENFFDISGHTFILVYSSFGQVEKARSIIGWENVKDQSERRNRIQHHISVSNPLWNLEDNELIDITKWCIFLLMTTLLVLCDSMLLRGTNVDYIEQWSKKRLPFPKYMVFSLHSSFMVFFLLGFHINRSFISPDQKVTHSFNCQTQAVIRVTDIISHKTIWWLSRSISNDKNAKKSCLFSINSSPTQNSSLTKVVIIQCCLMCDFRWVAFSVLCCLLIFFVALFFCLDLAKIHRLKRNKQKTLPLSVRFNFTKWWY